MMSDPERAGYRYGTWAVFGNDCRAEGGWSVFRDKTADSPHEIILHTWEKAEADKVAKMLNDLEAENTRMRNVLDQIAKNLPRRGAREPSEV